MTEKKRRRRHGEGSIYRRTDGCWCSVVDLGYINGKRVRKTVSGKTRKEVADKLPALLTAQQQGMALPTSTTKVSEFLTLWLEEAVKPTNAARTHESYSQLIKSRRTLPLPDVVVKGLRRRQEREKQDITLAGSHWRGDEWGLVFPSTIGTPLNGSNILQQLRGHLDRAGLLAFDFKTLRHTAATTLAMQGVPTRTAMAILGHSQMATTTDVYSHVIEDSMRTAVDSVELAYQPKAVAKRPVLKRRRSALPTTHKASKGAS